MSLLSALQRTLTERAAAPALEFSASDGSTTRLTFGDFAARSARLASALRHRGLCPGDRLAFFLPNRPEVIDLWLAALQTGVILVPTNVLYRERELRHILSDAAPRAVITTRDLAAHLPAGTETWLVEESASWPTEPDRIPDRATSKPRAVADDDATPVALIYTSGTTGAAKGAVLTRGNFLANGRELVRAWEFTASDRLLCTLPLFHVHGLANAVHCWLISGCHLRLTERFDHTQATGWFEAYRPTVFFGVPAMFVRLLDVPAPRAATIGHRLRLAVSGSAPLPAEIHERFRTLFGSVILERYGMTETLMNVGNPYHGERRAGTVGKPFAHVEVEIRDDAGTTVADGTTGELWVRGPNVCSGYWQRPDATAAAWREGWFRTGDIGVRAADGYITLQGRRSDLIISGGFNLYPREIEELILEQPGVKEAVVVGAADPVRGEVPVAYVVADDAFNADRAIRHLRTQLASFKIPRGFVRVDALPRTALGKIQKHLLPPFRG
jgi:malonyl-CoA/methylmalonyl-CoA synthetase